MEDAISRLKRRARATVPPRDLSAVGVNPIPPLETNSSLVNKASRLNDVKTEKHQEAKALKTQNEPLSGELSLEETLEGGLGSVKGSSFSTEESSDPQGEHSRMSINLDVETKRRHSLETSIIRTTSKTPDVVRSTVRLDSTIDRALRDLCVSQKVTKETLLEAAYLLALDQEKWQEAWIAIARDRYQQRKQVAELRKYQTLKKRLES